MRIIAFALVAVMAACATPGSRIKAHQKAFDSYPPETQRRIREGTADVGFTREQVMIALGAPARKYTRKAADVAQEIWVYGIRTEGPRLGFGFGLGSAGLGGGVSAATGVESGDGGDARVRVVFQDGLAVSVESREQ